MYVFIYMYVCMVWQVPGALTRRVKVRRKSPTKMIAIGIKASGDSSESYLSKLCLVYKWVFIYIHTQLVYCYCSFIDIILKTYNLRNTMVIKCMWWLGFLNGFLTLKYGRAVSFLEGVIISSVQKNTKQRIVFFK